MTIEYTTHADGTIASRRTASPMEALRATRTEVVDQLDKFLKVVAERGEGRMLADEQRAFDKVRNDLKLVDERIAELEQQEKRVSAVAPLAARADHFAGQTISVNGEARTYRPDGDASYFGDLLRRQIYNDSAAAERLTRHRAENDVERRDLSRTDTAGGEFVPPAWLMDKYAEKARHGRVTADRFMHFPLPPGTDSLNVPRITTGASTDVQTTDNASVSETDMVTATVTAPVRTIAGQQDVSLQLLEQSPIRFDEVVFRDLLADYNRTLERQVISGTGTSGQLEGIRTVSGIGTVTYTDASPTIPELYPKGGSAQRTVIAAREEMPECCVMHPRRWVWMTEQLDGSSRPFIVPEQGGPQNAPATQTQLTDLSRPVGTWLSLPVYVSAGIPTTVGAGTEDVIIASVFSDHHLYEGTPRTRVLPEVLSGTLTVRLQLYNYVAATAARFPGSTAVITGTGLIAPS